MNETISVKKDNVRLHYLSSPTITAVQFHQLLLSSECGIASSSNIYLGFCQIKRRTGITMRNVADMLRATHQLT